MTCIPDSFVLHKVVFDSYGDVSQTLETYTAEDLINSGKLKIAADKKSFTLNLGNTSDQYSLKYKSTYVPGTQLTNSIELRSGAQTWMTGGSYKSAESKGTISGDPVGVSTGEIKIIKVDEDGTTPLKVLFLRVATRLKKRLLPKAMSLELMSTHFRLLLQAV